MRLTTFNGGLRTKQAPHLIEQNEARVCNNVDLDTGILEPLNDKEVMEANVGANGFHYYWDRADTTYSYSTAPDWLEFQSRLYFSVREVAPQYYATDGSGPFQLGLTGPNEETAPDWNINAVGPTEASHKRPEIESLAPRNFSSASIQKGRYYTHRAAKIVNVPGYGQMRFSGSSADVFVPDDDENNKRIMASLSVEDNDLEYGDTLELYRLHNDEWRLVTRIDSLSLDDTSLVLWFIYDESMNISFDYVEKPRLTGTYRYAITYADSTTGQETAAAISQSVVADNQYIALDVLLNITDSQIDTVHLYRIGNNLSEFTRVQSFAKSAIPQGATSTEFILDYLDQLQDDELEGTLLTSNDYLRAARLRYLAESYAVLFAVVDYGDSGYEYPNRLHFTPIAEPENWPALNYLTFPTDITGVAAVGNGVLVFTLSKTYLVTGYDPESFNQILLSASQGCLSHDSIAVLHGSAIWVSQEGICISDGSSIENITESKLGALQLDPRWAVIHNQIYYLVLQDRTMLTLDLKTGRIQTLDILVNSLYLKKGELWAHWGASWNASRYRMFTDASKVSFEYVSPVYINNSYVMSKVYKHLYVTLIGQIELEVFIDGVSVKVYSFNTDTKQLEDIKLPSSATRGLELQFKISGTGKVFEIYCHEGDAHS